MTTALPYRYQVLRQPYTISLIVWLAAMICVPIARWTFGDNVIPMMAVITTVLQCATVVLILHSQWQTRQTLIVLIIVGCITYFAEYVGSKTGFPFGDYTYTALLQPQLLGVPMIIPLAWLMMLAPAWGIAYTILDKQIDTPQRRLLFVILSAFAITAWDFFLDPQMVGWGFWVWDNPSGYFGIPWVNFVGWMLTAMLVTVIVNPTDLPTTPLILIYAIVWALQSIGLAVFWGQPGPAICGSIVMGIPLFFALWRYRKAR